MSGSFIYRDIFNIYIVIYRFIEYFSFFILLQPLKIEIPYKVIPLSPILCGVACRMLTISQLWRPLRCQARTIASITR